MQVITLNSVLVFNALSFSVLLLLSGCSNSNEVASVSTKPNLNKKVTVITAKPGSKKLQHVHTSNPCTAALSHSHVFENAEHEHKYDCENTNEFVRNAHIHIANKKMRRFRHVHPNGANKHSHHGE